MKKIFIVEDDEDITDILTIALGARYNLSIINDTNNLMERMSDFIPDLIITDNFVGQKVAAEIIKAIRSEHRFSNIPVILFSGHPDIEKLSKEIEANAYLSKPFTLKELNSCIEKVSAELTAVKEVQG
ncbi:MAG: response regulator [Bacteroidota bacterium]|nr:response regulator [Bacteroidota bacterium]